MTTKILALWMAACAAGAAKPGDLDRNFNPELRAWVAPDRVMVADDGRVWIGGGFDRGDGDSTGDLLRLGENGGVEGEPAPGYLGKRITISIGSTPENAIAPFLLADGGFLLPGESAGWLRLNAAGNALGKAFPDRQAGETITPQFERNGKLWVIRRFANGERILERRASEDGSVDGSFTLAAEMPRNVNTAVPGPDGSVWVLAGEEIPWYYFPDGSGTPLPEQRIYQVNADGNPVGAPRVIAVSRTLDLVAGPAGAFRLVYGADQSMWNYWPSPGSKTYEIEWYSAMGVLERTLNFTLPLSETFVWAEAADGSFMVTDAMTRIAGGSRYFIAKVASLRRYGPDGVEDASFIRPGRVRSVKYLTNGKWLIDGLWRLNADGSEDASWAPPELSTPAQVAALLPLPDGRVLVGGNFATTDGWVSNRLVVFRANGELDPSFIADERIGEWRSVAVAGMAIYVVTKEPVDYGNEVRSNLVKLDLDGTLVESYEPQVPVTTWSPGVRFQTVDSVVRCTGLTGGDILVETYALGGDIFIHHLDRLNADGSRDGAFRRTLDFKGFSKVLALAGGGFAGDGVIYRPNGAIERDLTRANSWLTPLCEGAGGVLFQERGSFTPTRLRLWTRSGFASWFHPPSLDWSQGVSAVPGECGAIYLTAALAGGRPGIHRLLPDGGLDRRFRAPDFGYRERQEAVNWWKVEESGMLDFNPALHESGSAPQILLWHPASQRLWTGGNFNVVGGQPRDGLARLYGGFPRWSWW